MTPEVAQAIDEIAKQFTGHPLLIGDDLHGGACVIVEDLPLGPPYAADASWVGFHVTHNCPYADIYPHFMRADLSRRDHLALGEGISPGHIFRKQVCCVTLCKFLPGRHYRFRGGLTAAIPGHRNSKTQTIESPPMDSISVKKPWRLVIPQSLFERLMPHLFPGDHDEHGAVVEAGMHVLPDGSVRLLARNLHLAKDCKDYVPGRRGYRMLKAEFIRDRIISCRDQKLVYLAIHNHGQGDAVGFSSDDFASHERGYPALLDIARGMPVGALVFASNAVAGDIWLPGGDRMTLDGLIVIGQCRKVLRPQPDHSFIAHNALYDRQARLFGMLARRFSPARRWPL